MLQKQKRVQFKTAQVSTEFRGDISAAACAGGQPASVYGGLKGSAGVLPGLSRPACAIPFGKARGGKHASPLCASRRALHPPAPQFLPGGWDPRSPRARFGVFAPPPSPCLSLLGAGWGSAEEGSGSGEAGGGGGGRDVRSEVWG